MTAFQRNLCSLPFCSLHCFYSFLCWTLNSWVCMPWVDQKPTSFLCIAFVLYLKHFQARGKSLFKCSLYNTVHTTIWTPIKLCCECNILNHFSWGQSDQNARIRHFESTCWKHLFMTWGFHQKKSSLSDIFSFSRNPQIILSPAYYWLHPLKYDWWPIVNSQCAPDREVGDIK